MTTEEISNVLELHRKWLAYEEGSVRTDLRNADLYGANLSCADLRNADLRNANLYSADLSGANLSDASLSGADLRSANLSGANLPPFQIPQEGELIVWKKARGGLVKLRVPTNAKRTMSLVGPTAPLRGIHNPSVTYAAGATVRPDSYDPDPRVECTHGIHFFLTREEAEEYCG